jgi:hypothetical protein
VVSLNPYQRGNRDGLRSFAFALEIRAEECRAQGEWWSERGTPVGDRTALLWHAKAAAFREASENALRMAEALPEDPEEPAP